MTINCSFSSLMSQFWLGWTALIFCPVAGTGLRFGCSDINIDNMLMFQLLLSRACSKSRSFNLQCFAREAVLERLGGRLHKPAKGIWHSLECHAQCTNWGELARRHWPLPGNGLGISQRAMSSCFVLYFFLFVPPLFIITIHY